MNAAALSSLELVRALIDARAHVNASSQNGATALMWSTGDIAKVRLLLDRGAAVNARMKDGSSALVTAARRGNLDVMRLLLARGSDPKSAAQEITELLRIAFSERPETRQVLADAGIDLKALTSSATPPLATLPSVANADLVRELLDMGVSPNPKGRFPIVGYAAFEGHVQSARVLLERGADPNARGQHGVTPLMMAAAATRPDPAMVRLFLERGVDLSARDVAKRSALDWALLQGETSVARMLRDAGGQATAPAALPPTTGSKPRPARVAVSDALARLQPGVPDLYERSKCVSCHHQMLPLMAVSLAKARGVPVEAEAAARPVQAITVIWNTRRENLMMARSRDGGGANELTYGLLALAEAGVARNSVTDAAVVNLISTQRSNGSWVFLDTRPPQADNSPIPFTAMAIRALEVYGPPGLRQEVSTSRRRALEYLRATTSASTQDEAFKLLGLVWSRVARAEIAAQAKRLMALQRTNGGWSQLPAMASDSYATGQALYALHAGGMVPKDRAYERGVAYLLRTQLEDGTWFVQSRAFGFQPYFETGFPHGVHQFISASATAWATIALALTL
jgi:ankyrin repeat protein